MNQLSTTKHIFSVSVICVLMIVLAACTDESTAPLAPVDTTIVERLDLRADSAIGWLYYSIDGDSVVSPALAGTNEWDVRMKYLLCCGKTRNVEVYCNSGSAGSGATQAIVVSGRFESVTSLASTSVPRNDNAAAPIIHFLGANPVWLYSGAPNHTLVASPDKIIAIQTRKGRLVKFQFTSIYQGRPATPTQESPIGFYHFRYANLRK